MTHDKLVGLYWVSNPSIYFNIKETPGITGIIEEWTYTDIVNIINNEIDVSLWIDKKRLLPHLKPLSSITQDDAIAVAKMAIGVNESSRLYSWALKKRGVVLGTPSPSLAGEVFAFEIDEFKWSLSVYLHGTYHGERDVKDPWEITDYLRSKSYNLDFKEGQYIPIASPNPEAHSAPDAQSEGV